MFGIGMPGIPELLIVGVIGILLFGNKLPKIAHSVGSSLVEFKRGLKGVEDDIKEVTDEVKS